jgi:hypothetical protein
VTQRSTGIDEEDQETNIGIAGEIHKIGTTRNYWEGASSIFRGTTNVLYKIARIVSLVIYNMMTTLILVRLTVLLITYIAYSSAIVFVDYSSLYV